MNSTEMGTRGREKSKTSNLGYPGNNGKLLQKSHLLA